MFQGIESPVRIHKMLKKKKKKGHHGQDSAETTEREIRFTVISDIGKIIHKP